jgi:two-component system OmpR family response regulator
LTLRVFIVEDSPEIVEGLTELLARDARCAVVGHAVSEQLALEWSFQNEAGFDVAILDLLLRDGSGFAVLAHLTKYQPGKAVVLSEYVTPVMAEKCKALGAVAAFPKSKIEECVLYVRALAEGDH